MKVDNYRNNRLVNLTYVINDFGIMKTQHTAKPNTHIYIVYCPILQGRHGMTALDMDNSFIYSITVIGH